MSYRKSAAFLTVLFSQYALCSLAMAEPAPAGKPTIAKICLNCHKAEPGTLRGHFDGVSLKSKVIQLKIDDGVELLKFDEKAIQVVNEARQAGDAELLKNNKLKKGHEVKVEYSEANGVKTVVKLTAKPPVELPKEMLISTAEMEKLVAMGPEKGKYFLFDSRPAPRFQEGAIPTAVNLPFPAFDKLAEKLLPADKNARIIFYCSGITCNMSPGSAANAKKLGYTNIKVYREGMPAWSEKNYAVLSTQSLKETWLDKELSHVLLDARPAATAAKGFIKGAVSFPAAKAVKLVKGLELKDKKAPIIVYDAKEGKDAGKVAKELIKSGYGNVKVVSGGFAGWQAASYQVASGTMAAKAVYVPKPRQGEIDIEEFRKFAQELPANVMIVDVRLPEETKAGMIKTAKALPLVDLRERAVELPKDKQIVLQCNTGTQAEMAYHTLKEMGYSNVKYLRAKVKFAKDGTFELTKE